jgi:hypothetical protein
LGRRHSSYADFHRSEILECPLLKLEIEQKLLLLCGKPVVGVHLGLPQTSNRFPLGIKFEPFYEVSSISFSNFCQWIGILRLSIYTILAMVSTIYFKIRRVFFGSMGSIQIPNDSKSSLGIP